MRVSMRLTTAALALAAVAGLVAGAPAVKAQSIEKQQALNGSLYAVVAPTYTDDAQGSGSYVRLFNGNQASASTFLVSVVGTCSGTTYGTAQISVQSDASPQFSLETILGMAGTNTNAITAASSCDTASGNGPALYIQNSDPTASYEHVTFNAGTNLFGDVSNCKVLINEAFIGAGHNGLALINVHTTQLAAFPSQVTIHNFWNAAVTYHVSVYDAGTADGSGTIRPDAGTKVGQHDYAVGANASLSLSMSQIQTDIGWTPSSSQPHANLVLTDTSGGSPYAAFGQSIVNQRLGGFIDMSNACAVNAVTSSSDSGGLAPPPTY